MLRKLFNYRNKIDFDVIYPGKQDNFHGSVLHSQRTVFTNLGETDPFIEITFFMPKWWQVWLRPRIIIKMRSNSENVIKKAFLEANIKMN